MPHRVLEVPFDGYNSSVHISCSSDGPRQLLDGLILEVSTELRSSHFIFDSGHRMTMLHFSLLLFHRSRSRSRHSQPDSGPAFSSEHIPHSSDCSTHSAAQSAHGISQASHHSTQKQFSLSIFVRRFVLASGLFALTGVGSLHVLFFVLGQIVQSRQNQFINRRLDVVVLQKRVHIHRSLFWTIACLIDFQNAVVGGDRLQLSL